MIRPSNVVPTSLDHLVYLCRNMRADEAEQLRAFYVEEDCLPDVVAARLYAQPGPRYTLVDDTGIPMVVGGFHLTNGNVWQSWMVGCPAGWETSWRSITKASRWLAWALFKSGATKIETVAIGNRVEAHQWYLRALKMRPEGVRRCAGLRGEDLHLFGVLAEEF